MSWKVVAIIFIILFVLETTIFAIIVYNGMRDYEVENRCGLYCQKQGFMAYQYDQYDKKCLCYDGSGELAHTIPLS